MKAAYREAYQYSTSTFLPFLSWTFVAAVCAIACIFWSWYAGKDLNWDSLNYHFYVAYQWSEDRLSKDFLAASIQSYLNPIAYLPFFYMVQANWPSVLIGATLAAVHSVNLVLIGHLAEALLPRGLQFRKLWIGCAIVLAALNPIYASEVGSTFNDATTSIFVIAGYVFVLRELVGHPLQKNNPPGFRYFSRWALAGFLLGAAVGLKLTNIIFAVALGLLIVRPYVDGFGARLHRAIHYGSGLMIGFLAVNGWWTWRLFQEFGNPFFPYFNSLFESPDFPLFDIRNYRFIPESFVEALIFPLDLLRPVANIYTELAAPDARFAVFFAIAFVYAILLVLRRNGCEQGEHVIHGRADGLHSILLVWGVCYGLWLYTSGNGRYFLPASLMLGPIIVGLALRLFRKPRYVIYFLVPLIWFQAIQIKDASGYRWSPSDWAGRWFEVNVPRKLVEEPYLYLVPSVQSSMFVAPYLNKDSSFVSIAGQVSVPADSFGGARIKDLITRHQTRSLYVAKVVTKDNQPLPGTHIAFDGVFQRYGLQTDVKSCEVIDVGNLHDGTVVYGDTRSVVNDSDTSSLVISCSLIPFQEEAMKVTEERSRVDRVFDRIEAACPLRFNPAGVTTERFATTWHRKYVNSDTDLWLSSDGTIKSLFFGDGEPENLGAIETWERTQIPPIRCRLNTRSLISNYAEL